MSTMRMDAATVTIVGRAGTNPMVSASPKGDRVTFRVISTERRFDEARQDWVDGDEYGGQRGLLARPGQLGADHRAQGRSDRGDRPDQHPEVREERRGVLHRRQGRLRRSGCGQARQPLLQEHLRERATRTKPDRRPRSTRRGCPRIPRPLRCPESRTIRRSTPNRPGSWTRPIDPGPERGRLRPGPSAGTRQPEAVHAADVGGRPVSGPMPSAVSIPSR